MHIECVRESGRPQGELSEKSYKWLDLLGLFGVLYEVGKEWVSMQPKPGLGDQSGEDADRTRSGLDPGEGGEGYVSTNHAPGPCHPVG